MGTWLEKIRANYGGGMGSARVTARCYGSSKRHAKRVKVVTRTSYTTRRSRTASNLTPIETVRASKGHSASSQRPGG